MGIHALGFFGSAIGTTANTQVNALTNDRFPITNNTFLYPQRLNIYGAMVVGPQVNTARLWFPTQSATAFNRVYPCNQQATQQNNYAVDNWTWANSSFGPSEPLELDVTNANSGDVFGQAFVGDSIQPINASPLLTIRFTSTTTAVVNSYSSLTTTFDQTLAPGTYNLINVVINSANIVMGRCLIPGQFFTPPIGVTTSLANRPHDFFITPSLGVLGVFNNVAPPTFDVVCRVADNSFTGFMVFQRVS